MHSGIYNILKKQKGGKIEFKRGQTTIKYEERIINATDMKILKEYLRVKEGEATQITNM